MIGAGTIISPIIRIITTVAILAAIYFFFVKPALDTTESISSNISDSIDESFDNFDTFTPDVKQVRPQGAEAPGAGAAELLAADRAGGEAPQLHQQRRERRRQDERL